MAKRNILRFGDETLRKVCRPVTEITPQILTLLDDLAETMHKAEGVGLAAPQVGVLRRVAVIETEPGQLIELINPKIIAYSGEQEGVEACLSVPGRQGMVTRPMNVTVQAMNRRGETVEITGHELLARCFCHEIDHLDGVLYIDRVKR